MVTEVYEALVSAGADEAKAAAAAIPVTERIAAKQDLAEVKSELKQDIADVKQNIADVKSELKQDIADVKQNIADVKSELKQDIADVRSELKQDIAVLKFAVFSFGPVIVGLLIKLVFFP